MTNSDSGTSNRTVHRPGDRVRIRHNPRHDHSYSAEQNQARQALGGQIGSIRERTVAGAYRVAPPGSVERGAWFEADELVPIVTDADGLPVGGAAAPASDRPVPELRAAIAAIVDALETKLGTAAQEAARWHEAAQDARQEAREAKERLQAVEAERDALRGKLVAAEEQRDAWRHRALMAEATLGTQGRGVDPWQAEIEARLGRLESGEAAKRAEGDRIFGGSGLAKTLEAAITRAK